MCHMVAVVRATQHCLNFFVRRVVQRVRGTSAVDGRVDASKCHVESLVADDAIESVQDVAVIGARVGNQHLHAGLRKQHNSACLSPVEIRIYRPQKVSNYCYVCHENCHWLCCPTCLHNNTTQPAYPPWKSEYIGHKK